MSSKPPRFEDLCGCSSWCTGAEPCSLHCFDRQIDILVQECLGLDIEIHGLTINSLAILRGSSLFFQAILEFLEQQWPRDKEVLYFIMDGGAFRQIYGLSSEFWGELRSTSTPSKPCDYLLGVFAGFPPSCWSFSPGFDVSTFVDEIPKVKLCLMFSIEWYCIQYPWWSQLFRVYSLSSGHWYGQDSR